MGGIMILEEVNYPKDIKKLKIKEKKKLANELRNEILEVVSQNGGHLASNLGCIELTIVLISIFDFTKDKIVFDVGHQTYAYKILTGRKEKFKTLRKKDGIAGFPRTRESKYDFFDTGHSSTSISAALGMARARDIKGRDYKVIAVIGDGALTGGMALEALNDAGISGTDLIVILNDNGMSISKNTGGMSRFLTKLRSKKIYVKSNASIKKAVNHIPYIGKPITKSVTRIKNGIKGLIIPKMYFENIGFTYLGPVDGHNIESLESIFKMAQNIKGPILIHTITQKGKGYAYAEKNPNSYHAVSPFNLKEGKKKNNKKDYSSIMGDELVKLAGKNKNIVAITAAMEDGTGLSQFAKEFPERFFDVEIAEQHALTMAAGMAISGLQPVVPIYSSFLQRGFDQMIHDIAMQNLPVTICVDRAGIVGSDGETHQGILDLSYLNTIPNMTVISPKNYEELRLMLNFALSYKKPIAIRYPRGTESNYHFPKSKEIKLGEAEIIKKGKDITIVAIGNMVTRAMEVAELLEKDGISSEVINARFLKPLDTKTIAKSYQKTKLLVTIEDNIKSSGLGATIKSKIKENKEILSLGYPDTYIKQGTIEEIEKEYSLDKISIYNTIKKILK